VPAGHYWAVGDFISFGGSGFRVRIAVRPQFTVSGNTTVRVAERSANSKITMTTPRPAVSQQTSFTLIRSGQAGAASSVGWVGTGVQFWVSPTSRKPTVGGLQAFTSAQLTSPRHAAVPYVYNLAFAGPAGLIPPQHFIARQASLATVAERYYQDVPSTGAWSTFGGFLAQFQSGVVSTIFPLKLRGGRSSTCRAARASSGPASTGSSPAAGREISSAGRPTRSGPCARASGLAEAWNRYPLHPAPNVSLVSSGLFLTLPSAGRAGNLLVLDSTPFSDNQLAISARDSSADSSGGPMPRSAGISKSTRMARRSRPEIPSIACRSPC